MAAYEIKIDTAWDQKAGVHTARVMLVIPEDSGILQSRAEVMGEALTGEWGNRNSEGGRWRVILFRAKQLAELQGIVAKASADIRSQMP